MEMELTEIISELENYTGKFPRLALEKAIEKKEEITPLLLENLSKWKDNLPELLELPDYFLHIYALHLLAQFRETKAYPLIIDFFSAPGDITLDVTGDLVTEDLGNILASVSDGNIEPVKVLIENPQVNEYVRSAALKCLMVLVAQDVISRELVIEYFRELFSTKLEKEYSYIWTSLVINSTRLYPFELKEYIDQTFEANLVDVFFINQKSIDSILESGRNAVMKELREQPDYGFIEDTISDMESWACFRDEKEKKITYKPLELGKIHFDRQKKSHQSKKKKKRKMQKEARKKNRFKKK